MACSALAAPCAHSREPSRPDLIAADGFGDARNSYAWSMAWFKGALYVGTARSAMCVEGATMAYYLPAAGFYARRPAPGVTCPRTIHHADLRAEIWRYDPRAARWARVYRSPRDVRDPRAPGRYVARDIGYRGMAVVREAGGRRSLYVGAFSADEFLPELARSHPPRILRSTDGRRFRDLRVRPGIIHTAHGPRRPVGYRAMAVLDGRLYVTASPGITGDGVVMRLHTAGRGAPRMEQVSPPSLAVFELEVFDGALYAGSGDVEEGYGVWRATGPRASAWAPIVTGGAGRGSTMMSVVSMARFRQRLYVSANGWGTTQYPPSELIRVAADGTWEVVVGNPRRDAAGDLRSPVSGLPDSFGNPFNSHFWRMAAHGGALVLGTNDWSWSVRGTPQVLEQLRPQIGFDLFGTCDGADWFTLTRNGFDRAAGDFGIRTMVSSPAGLFLGTTNHTNGAAVYRSRGALCAGAAVRDSRAAAVARSPAPMRSAAG